MERIPPKTASHINYEHANTNTNTQTSVSLDASGWQTIPASTNPSYGPAWAEKCPDSEPDIYGNQINYRRSYSEVIPAVTTLSRRPTASSITPLPRRRTDDSGYWTASASVRNGIGQPPQGECSAPFDFSASETSPSYHHHRPSSIKSTASYSSSGYNTDRTLVNSTYEPAFSYNSYDIPRPSNYPGYRHNSYEGLAQDLGSFSFDDSATVPSSEGGERHQVADYGGGFAEVSPRQSVSSAAGVSGKDTMAILLVWSPLPSDLPLLRANRVDRCCGKRRFCLSSGTADQPEYLQRIEWYSSREGKIITHQCQCFSFSLHLAATTPAPKSSMESQH